MKRWVGALSVAVALAMSGCAADYVTGNNAAVNLYVTAINEGSPMDSDVRHGTNADRTTVPNPFVCPDRALVSVAVRFKNQQIPTPSVPNAVFLESYEVKYTRTDGRGTEGIDVPYRITGNLTLAVDASDSDNSEVAIEVVRRQAKLEPPLSTINQNALLTTMAEITLYGKTTSGQRVTSSGRMQITFADYGEDNTSCPEN
jgi:hypothetical protein